MLEIVIAEKTYADRGGRRHLALRDLSLAVATGEFVCLVGPSGSGKSTLLTLVGGLDTELGGSIRIGGEAPASPRQRVGFMFQEPRLMPWLTVLDNVRLVLDDRLPADAADARARELLTAMELGDVLDAYPNTLSGGMQRRVALARAFVIEPQLLLMDEPFVSLDAPTAQRLRTMLATLWQRQRTTVLFVTHDLREALSLADRVCFLSPAPGRIIHELPIDLPRPRQPQDAAVSALYERLMQAHPDLLAGLATHAAPVEASA
jgi:NitT/TauT family transport system ATP-binding protein